MTLSAVTPDGSQEPITDGLDGDPLALFNAFGIDGPPVLRDITVEFLKVVFSFGNKEFRLKAAGSLPLGGGATARLSISVGLARRTPPPGYIQTYTGTLTLRVPQSPGTYRELVFGIGKAEHAEFTATWSDTEGVSLADLARLLGAEDEVLADLGALGTVTTATLAYSSVRKSFVLAAAGRDGAGSLMAVSARRKNSGERDWAVRVSLGLNASLSGVPLLRGKIPEGLDTGVRGLGVLIGSKGLTAERTAVLNQALAAADASLPLLPAEGVPAGVGFSVEVLLPGQKAPTSVTVRAARRPAQRGGTPAQDLAAEQSRAPLVAWLSVEREVGPLRLGRVGVAYAGGTVWVLFEASLGMAGLLLAVDGLGVGVSPSDPANVRFRLDGLGVGYGRPPLVIKGALINRPDPAFDVLILGALVVAMQRYGLTALAGYAKDQELPEPSMFVFGKLGGKFGAPPVAISAIMAGFGYHTTVRVPEGDRVVEFPFLKDLGEEPDSDPLVVLKALMSGKDAWVRPATGQLWFAAGLGCTLFEFLDCQVLVILEVGRDFALAVLGTADAQFPRSPVPGMKPYARARLGLSARYRASEGVVKISAALAPGSYLLDEACVLTGGFAFSLWTAGGNAGDFVLTLGGYHPRYVPAPHYPQVPRLGLVWPVTTGLTIDGGVYFALTPGAIMAGGRLAVNYRSGSLHAWLTAYADLLIEWAPFRFDVGIGISIGVCFTLNLWLVRTTIRVEVGATLQLSGPPTSGTVTVHLSFVRFTLAIGARNRPPDDKPVAWDEVIAQLPAKAHVVRLLAIDGLVPQNPEPVRPDAADTQTWLVGPDTFSFALRTAVPVTTLRLLGADHTERVIDGRPVHVRPRRAHGKDLASALVLALTDAHGNRLDLGSWVPPQQPGERPGERSDLPAALWAPYGGRLGVDSPQWAEDQLIGVDLRRPPPQPGSTPGQIKAGTLTHDDLSPDGQLPFAPQVPQETGAPPGAGTPQETVPDLTGAAVVWARDRLFSAMEYLNVSPRTNERLHADDRLVAGDVTVPHRPVGPPDPTPGGPRLYAVSPGSITPVDMCSLRAFTPSSTGQQQPFLQAGKDGTRACVPELPYGSRLQVLDIKANPPGPVVPLFKGNERPWITQKPLASALFSDGVRVGMVFEQSDQLIVLHLENHTSPLTWVGLGGFHPGGIAASLRSSRLYVSTLVPSQYGNVQVFDTGNLGAKATWRYAGPDPTVLAADPKGRWLYALNNGHSTVTADALHPAKEACTVRTGTDPVALAPTPDGKLLLVANSAPGTVSVCEVTDDRVRESADPVWVGPSPVALAVSPDSKRLFVARRNVKNLAVVDLAARPPALLSRTVPLDDVPMSLAVTAPPTAPTVTPAADDAPGRV